MLGMSVEVYTLENGQYILASESGRGGTVHSRLLDGLQVSVDEVLTK